MKNHSILSLFILLLVSCNQSVNKDLVTGAYSRGYGLNCDDVVIEINTKTVKQNTFIYGEDVYFNFNNVNGFTKEDGKVFPGLAMYVIQNKKDTIRSFPDLFKNTQGTDLSPLQLKAHIMMGFPHQNKEKYALHIAIWDKKGDGKYTYTLPFTVKKSDVLTISGDLSNSNIYLWNETQNNPIINQHLNKTDTLNLILEGLHGFTEVDNKVFPLFSIKIQDHEGNYLLKNDNLLANYKDIGIDSKKILENQLTAILSFSQGTISNPCKIEAVLTDQKSDKTLRIFGEFVIE